jgi:hypothetical protein
MVNGHRGIPVLGAGWSTSLTDEQPDPTNQQRKK